MSKRLWITGDAAHVGARRRSLLVAEYRFLETGPMVLPKGKCRCLPNQMSKEVQYAKIR